MLTARALGSYCLGFVRSQGGRVQAIRYAREMQTVDTDGAAFWGAVASYLKATA